MDKCLGNQNMFFYTEIWNATSVFFAPIARYQSVPKKPNHRWQNLLSVAFAEMSGALRRCGLNEEQSAMLYKSLISLKSFHFRMDVTRARLHNSEISVDLQQAVKEWSKKRWYKFGEDLGKLLQQMVLVAFPKMHSADCLEKRRNLLLSFSMKKLQGGLGKHFRPLALIPAVPFTSSALLALATAAVAALRFFQRCFNKLQSASGDGLPSVEDTNDSDGALLAL